MKPPPFDYHAPSHLEEALELLARYGDGAKVLAGGQSLVPAMNFRLAAPAVLVDLNRILSLAYLREDGDGLVVGAMTRQRAVERSPLVRERAPLVSETMPHIAHPQIRARGTFGGSLAHADPAAELPAVLLALGGELRLRSTGGERSVAAEDFFVGLFETALRPAEVLTEVRLTGPQPRSGFDFEEMARRHGDFALAGVAASVRLDEAGQCEEARVALCSVGDTAVLAPSASAALVGTDGGTDAIAAAAARVATADIDPAGDIHASARYRRHLVEVLTRRALGRAFARARLATLDSN